MRSQLRLRILLPVAVLGLLGVGVGAFAMGGPPGSTAASPTTTTAPTTTAKTEPPAVLTRAAWAEQANELCAGLNSQVRKLGQPADLAQGIIFFEKVLELATNADRAFVALGWPKADRADVKRLWAASTAELKIGGEMLAAMKARDQEAFLRLFDRLKAVDRPYQKIVTRLGADRCAEDPFAPADPERGLAGALEENKVVVVLFYAPGSAYDTLQAREARAGAAAAGAGFLAVDVSRDRQVASLATVFDVRDAPAILVVTRGLKVAVRIDGYADRQAVAQAAANARA